MQLGGRGICDWNRGGLNALLMSWTSGKDWEPLDDVKHRIDLMEVLFPRKFTLGHGESGLTKGADEKQ